MRLLLDTHAFLWSASDPSQLTDEARAAISDAGNDVYVSAACAWEISIKTALGKLTLPQPPTRWFPARVRILGCTFLDITYAHALAAGELPSHHRDPFDRMMIAQAQIESLVFVTRDDAARAYDVAILRA